MYCRLKVLREPAKIEFLLDNLFVVYVYVQVRRQVSDSDSVDDGIGSYNYNNANDCANFCPDAGVRSGSLPACLFHCGLFVVPVISQKNLCQMLGRKSNFKTLF